MCSVVLKMLTVALMMKIFLLSTAKLAQPVRIEGGYCFCLSETAGGRFAKFETLTTLDLFEYVHRVITVKIHLHHSHGTGKIRGYAHDFCKMKVREIVKCSFLVLCTTFLVLICFLCSKGFDSQYGKCKI